MYKRQPNQFFKSLSKFSIGARTTFLTKLASGFLILEKRKIHGKTQNPYKKRKIHYFFKALGPISLYSSRNLVQNRTSSSNNCALRAKLWRFEVGSRISAPMLYITFWEIIITFGNLEKLWQII